MRFAITLMAAIAAGVVLSARAGAQELPVPDYPAVRDVPGAVLLPNTNIVHKVVFDNSMAAENVDDVNPMLVGVARYVNTLAKYGVAAQKRKIAVVFHRGSTPAILRNDAFRKKYDGHDNPNIELIRSLKAAGVEFHVCGQAVMGNDIDPKDILDEIQLDLWALTTIIDFEQRGYVKVGG